MPKDSTKDWVGDPLPRGRHKLPREAVRASQRERLLRAMEQLVGEHGYEATSVPQVIATARVSSNTFYSFFSDKADCFIALCGQQGEELFRRLNELEIERDRVPDALAALDAGISIYLEWWTGRPAFARAYFVELAAAGARALEERDRQYARFEAIHWRIAEAARALYPELPPVRDAEVIASALVVTELVAREVRAGRVERLSELHGDLRHLLLKLLVSERAAELLARAD